MKQIDATLKGVTLNFASGTYDQLFIIMTVNTCIMHSENDAKWDFPVPPIVRVCLEPFRLVVPLNDKHALITRGSEVEFQVTGTEDDLKVTLIKVVERNERSLKEFLKALQLKKE